MLDKDLAILIKYGLRLIRKILRASKLEYLGWMKNKNKMPNKEIFAKIIKWGVIISHEAIQCKKINKTIVPNNQYR